MNDRQRSIRHESRLRQLLVLAVEQPSPRLRRITLGGADLAGFASAGHDDHVKLFFPHDDGQCPVRGADGRLAFAEGVRPPARDYTPRRYDAARQELTIDFVLHEGGPATEWAARARPGDNLLVGGPRGSRIAGNDFDWYLLIGDETGLPAIGRRLEELPGGARAIVVAEVDGAADRQVLDSRARVEVHWVHRHGTAPGTPGLLLSAVAALELPEGEGHAWVAAESAVARALRRHLVDVAGLAGAHVRAAGYWKLGAAASHERHED